MADRTPTIAPSRTIVTGEFHAGLEDRLLSDLAARTSGQVAERMPVVVPTNLLRLRLSRTLARRVGGHVNVRFLTLKDFAATEAPCPLPDGRVPLPRTGDETLMRRVLDDGAADDGYFAAVADRPGLSKALLAAVRDLKEARYEPAGLAEAAKRSGLWGGEHGGKFRSLHYIWKSYERELERGGWVDDADVMRTASHALDQDTSRLAALVVYGFYDLNALQRSLLLSYARRADTTVYFPFLPIDPYRYALPTLEWLESVGFERTELSDSDRPDSLASGAESHRVPLPAHTKIISAPGEAREAREDMRVLRDILDRDAVPLREAAVLLRSAEPSSELFGDEAAKMGARPYVEAPPPLSRTGSGRALLKLTEAAASDFARAEVIEFLNLADVARRAPGEAPKSEWNRLSMVAGVVSGSEAWKSGLERLSRRFDEASPDSRFAEEHGDLAASLPELQKIVATILERMSELPVRDLPARFLERLVDTFLEVTRPSDERDSIVRAASRLRALSDIAGPVTFSRFAEMLRAALGTPSDRGVRFEEGGPCVHNLMSARGLRFEVVIIPGLVERSFPLSRRQDPILLDGERRRLNDSASGDPLSFLPVRTEGGAEEELLFRLAVRSAASTLILSFPRLDPVSARPRIPSVFLLDALESLTGEDQDYESFERSPLVTRIPLSRRFPDSRADAITRDEFDGCSILAAVESGSPEEVAYLLHEAGPLGRALAMERARWNEHRFTEYDGAMKSPEAVSAARELTCLFADTKAAMKPASATALEEYAACPFRFFMHRVLGIEPLDEPEETLELSPKDRGTLYHSLLEGFMKRAREDGRLPLSSDDAPRLLAAAERVVKNGDWGLIPGPGAVRLILQDMVSSLVQWLQHEVSGEEGLIPSYFEARFGGRRRTGDDDRISTERTLRYRVSDDVDLELGGKIDRIDVSADGTRAAVMDYKTGSPKSDRKTFDHGRSLQLPFYLMAAKGLLDTVHAGCNVEFAEYLHVGRGRPTARRLSSELLHEKEDELRQAVALILQGIRAGMFFPYPDDACRYCDYADACGSTAATALAVIKNADPRASFFVNGLAEIE